MPTVHLPRRKKGSAARIKGVLFLALAMAASAQTPPLTITTTSPLLAGDVGSSYQIILSASGGTGEYSWAVTAGSLPAGISLDSGCLFFASTCTIYGIPTTAGTSNFTLQVTDNNQPPDVTSAPFALTINAVPTLPGGALPGATVNTYYSQPVTVNGGTAPFYWSALGSLPPGLSLDSGTCPLLESGFRAAGHRLSTRGSPVNARPHARPRQETPNECLIVGQPTTVGTSTFTISVEDSYASYTYSQYTITVNPTPTITTNTLPNGTLNTSYAQTIGETGGTPPFVWSVTSGALPNGLALNSSTGQISGTPTVPGTANVTIQLSDFNGVTASKAYSLTILAPPTITAVSPLPAGTVGVSYLQTVAVTGGTSPYYWSVTVGALPAGLSLNSGNGQISGTPTTAGTAGFTVQVNDYNQLSASKAFSLTINPPLAITTTSPLPSGTVGLVYSQPLTATGGIGPYTWVLHGGNLPAGLALNSATGQISGTPTAAGTSAFSVQVSDTQALRATASFSVSIIAGLVITTSSPLPAGTLSQSYSQPLAANGGVQPYTWSVSVGSLPAGLSLNSTTGVISGTPTASGTANFTVQVTDSAGTIASAALSITINAALTITTTALPDGSVGAPYSQPVGVTGGTVPYTYALSTGVLPGGLSLSSTGGLITGKPTSAGSWTFTVQVTDATRFTASKQLSLTINTGLAITSTSPLTGGSTTSNYSFAFQASGGVQPYTWAVTSGALPKGITLNSATGVISGTPAAGGTANFTMQVTDSNEATASGSFSLTIVAGPAITSANLPSPFLGSTYSMQLQAVGSNGPFTWAVTAGSLPNGLTLSSGGLLSGTPIAPGTYSFTVTVTDASNNTATMSYSLVVAQVPLTLNIQVPSTAAQPLQQIDVAVTLPQAYPVDLAGLLTLQFAPNQSAPVVDPAIQFVTGGNSVPFQIPAGSTTALFSVSPIAVQTGTVAGTITLAATATAGGIPIALSNNPEVTVSLAPEAPGILGVTIQQLSSGFNVLVTGYSNTREITRATFTFTPQSGSQLQTTSFTPSGVDTAFQSWFGSDASTPFGSQFLYTQPFTLSSGAVSTLQSVTVTLTNSQGASATASANF